MFSSIPVPKPPHRAVHCSYLRQSSVGVVDQEGADLADVRTKLLDLAPHHRKLGPADAEAGTGQRRQSPPLLHYQRGTAQRRICAGQQLLPLGHSPFRTSAWSLGRHV